MDAEREALRLLEWDSAFFGVRVGRLAPGLGAGEFARAVSTAREQGFDCLHLLSPVEDLAGVRLAEEHLFRLVDVRLEYAIEAQELRAPVAADRTGRVEHAEPPVRAARADDVPALRAIAAGSHRSARFHSDGGFDPARCDELYATWIEKSCAGYADHVHVAEHEGAPAGYATCHLRDGGRGEIGLVGLAARARGRGLGRALVERALGWFGANGCERVTVATQARSLDAQRLYQAAGLRSSAVSVWHHRWLTR